MAEGFDISGIWHSTYRYPSSSRKGVFVGEHDVQLFGAGNEIVIQSLPNDTGSYLLLRLVLDGRLLTGTWYEYTSPGGHYKGAMYYGGIQLVLDEDRNTLRGKWVGHTKDMTVESGDWEIVRAKK